jgi:hypothetical protein
MLGQQKRGRERGGVGSKKNKAVGSDRLPHTNKKEEAEEATTFNLKGRKKKRGGWAFFSATGGLGKNFRSHKTKQNKNNKTNEPPESPFFLFFESILSSTHKMPPKKIVQKLTLGEFLGGETETQLPTGPKSS